MKVSAIFDRIAGRQQERQQAREADFRQLVVQIADGQEPDSDTIEHVLGGNQKTVDDLRKAVEHLERRRELRRTVDNAPNLAEERERIEQQIVEADRIFEEADAKHDETVDPLRVRIRQLRTLTSEAEQARQELWNTCGDKDLVERLNEVVPPLNELSRELATKETEARDLRNRANYEQSEAQLATREPNVEYHKEEAKRCNTEAKQLESQLPALRRRVADLQEQDRAIREAMLVP